MGHSFHTQTHMHRADLAAQLGYGGPPPFWDDEDMFAGAPPACGPAEYWDDAHQACVPVSLPMPSTTSPMQCPPGQFFDYFKQACVAAAQPHAAGATFEPRPPKPAPYFVDPCPPCFVTDPHDVGNCIQFCDPQHPERQWPSGAPLPVLPPPPHAAGALGDVTIGPHLISPLGWPYAWGQAAGIWGQRDVPPEVAARRDDSPYRGDRGGGTGNPDWATVALVGIGVAGVLGLGYLLVRR